MTENDEESVSRWQHVVCYVQKTRSKKLTEEEAGGIRAITSRVRKFEMLVARTEIFPLKDRIRQILGNNLSDCTQ